MDVANPCNAQVAFATALRRSQRIAKSSNVDLRSTKFLGEIQFQNCLSNGKLPFRQARTAVANYARKSFKRTEAYRTRPLSPCKRRSTMHPGWRNQSQFNQGVVVSASTSQVSPYFLSNVYEDVIGRMVTLMEDTQVLHERTKTPGDTRLLSLKPSKEFCQRIELLLLRVSNLEMHVHRCVQERTRIPASLSANIQAAQREYQSLQNILHMSGCGTSLLPASKSRHNKRGRRQAQAAVAAASNASTRRPFAVHLNRQRVQLAAALTLRQGFTLAAGVEAVRRQWRKVTQSHMWKPVTLSSSCSSNNNNDNNNKVHAWFGQAMASVSQFTDMYNNKNNKGTVAQTLTPISVATAVSAHTSVPVSPARGNISPLCCQAVTGSGTGLGSALASTSSSSPNSLYSMTPSSVLKIKSGVRCSVKSEIEQRVRRKLGQSMLVSATSPAASAPSLLSPMPAPLSAYSATQLQSPSLSRRQRHTAAATTAVTTATSASASHAWGATGAMAGGSSSSRRRRLGDRLCVGATGMVGRGRGRGRGRGAARGRGRGRGGITLTGSTLLLGNDSPAAALPVQEEQQEEEQQQQQQQAGSAPWQHSAVGSASLAGMRSAVQRMQGELKQKQQQQQQQQQHGASLPPSAASNAYALQQHSAATAAAMAAAATDAERVTLLQSHIAHLQSQLGEKDTVMAAMRREIQRSATPPHLHSSPPQPKNGSLRGGYGAPGSTSTRTQHPPTVSQLEAEVRSLRARLAAAQSMADRAWQALKAAHTQLGAVPSLLHALPRGGGSRHQRAVRQLQSRVTAVLHTLVKAQAVTAAEAWWTRGSPGQEDAGWTTFREGQPWEAPQEETEAEVGPQGDNSSAGEDLLYPPAEVHLGHYVEEEEEEEEAAFYDAGAAALHGQYEEPAAYADDNIFVQPMITIHYATTWQTAFLHFSADYNAWTEVPGVPLEDSTRVGVEGQDPLKTITVEGSLLEFVLTDGQGNWDKAPGGGNYKISSGGTFLVENGFIKEL